jgi:predicted secreted protein
LHWATGIAVYFTVWWVVLFAVLPWGVRHDEEGPAGADRGAPQNPRLLLKALATTLIAGVVWLAIRALVESPYLSFRDPR